MEIIIISSYRAAYIPVRKKGAGLNKLARWGGFCDGFSGVVLTNMDQKAADASTRHILLHIFLSVKRRSLKIRLQDFTQLQLEKRISIYKCFGKAALKIVRLGEGEN